MHAIKSNYDFNDTITSSEISYIKMNGDLLNNNHSNSIYDITSDTFTSSDNSLILNYLSNRRVGTEQE